MTIMRPGTGRSRQTRPFSTNKPAWPRAAIMIAALGATAWLAMGHPGVSRLWPAAALWSAVPVFIAIANTLLYNLQRKTEVSAQRQESFKLYLEQRKEAVAGLASDSIMVRENSVRTLADLADEYADKRQDLINSLCSFLRESLRLEPGDDEQRLWQAAAVMIRERLRPGAPKRWDHCEIDLTGVVIKGGDFSEVDLSGVTLKLDKAAFIGGTTTFARAVFGNGSRVSFESARFDGGTVRFDDICMGTEAVVSFKNASFISGKAVFGRAGFYSKNVSFHEAQFLGGCVDFSEVARWREPPVFDFAPQDAPRGLRWPPPFIRALEGALANSWAIPVTDQTSPVHLWNLRGKCGLLPGQELFAYIPEPTSYSGRIFFSSMDVRFIITSMRHRDRCLSIPFDSLHELETEIVTVYEGWANDQSAGSYPVEKLKISYCGKELTICHFGNPLGNPGARETLERIKEIAKEFR